MKKFLLLSVIAGFMSLSLIANTVNQELAARVAKNYFYEKVGIAPDKIIFTETITVADLSNQALYYIFNLSDNAGFIIVAAESNSMPILAYSNEKNYKYPVVCPQHNDWMNNYANQISEIRMNNMGATPKIQNLWDNYSQDFELFVPQASKAVTPLLGNIAWDQGEGYNDACPADNTSTAGNGHVWAGCVSTATGMIMKYHEWPTTGIGSHSYTHPDYGTLSANFGSTTYNWANMPEDAPNANIAQLLFHIGVSVEMDYGWDGSGSYNQDAITALEDYFKYHEDAVYAPRSAFSDSAWVSMLKTGLDDAMPLLYAGQNVDESHAFVCDGYDNSDNFHFNWGWSGDYNGYFNIDNLNPGSTSYTDEQAAGFNIYPDPLAVEDFTSFNKENSFIYPNPVGNNITITVKTDEPSTITIHSMDGRVIFEENCSALNGNHILNMESLVSGVYFIRINSNNKNYINQFIKL